MRQVKFFLKIVVSCNLLLSGRVEAVSERISIEMSEALEDGSFYQSSESCDFEADRRSYGRRPCRSRHAVVAVMLVTGGGLLATGHYLQYMCNDSSAENCRAQKAGLPMMIVGGGFLSAAIGRASDILVEFLERDSKSR